MAARIYETSRDRDDQEVGPVAKDSRIEDARRRRVGVMRYGRTPGMFSRMRSSPVSAVMWYSHSPTEQMTLLTFRKYPHRNIF